MPTDRAQDTPDWITEFADLCVEGARRHEREARSLRKLGRTVLTPPPGTAIKYAGVGQITIETRMND